MQFLGLCFYQLSSSSLKNHLCQRQKLINTAVTPWVAGEVTTFLAYTLQWQHSRDTNQGNTIPENLARLTPALYCISWIFTEKAELEFCKKMPST